MWKLTVRACMVALAVGLSARAGGQFDDGRGGTVQGEALRGQRRFLRGMAWYDLGSARARALEADAVFAWNRAVQADYHQYLLDRARRTSARKDRIKETEDEAVKRQAETRRRWREQPTVTDVRSGLALNALAGDLADPRIPLARWRLARVDLPAEVSIEALAFRFADAPRIKLPTRLAASTVAVGRMKGDRWPVALRRTDLERERASYQRAVAVVTQSCAQGKPLRAPQVDAVRDALFVLKEKAVEVVPTSGGLRKQAVVFLDQLDEATKIFLDRDFAEELIGDVERHKATTVGELLGFMKKYRLLFAEADDNPEVWSIYQSLYDLLKRQKVSLDFADAEDAPPP